MSTGLPDDDGAGIAAPESRSAGADLPGRGLRVGVLALQGGVLEHLRMLEDLGADAVPIRTPAALESGLDAIVLPGGESSTIDRLLRLLDMRDRLAELLADGLPVLGTCAGLILLARTVEDPAPGQTSLGVLPITVRRNAFGGQLVSSTEVLDTALGPVEAAFIRAPEVTGIDSGVQVLARRGAAPDDDGPIVAVAAASALGLSFHPELTGDETFHRELLARAAAGRR